jgi:hypothetical protein
MMCEKSVQNSVSDQRKMKRKELTKKEANSISHQVKNTPERSCFARFYYARAEGVWIFGSEKNLNLGDRLPLPDDPGRCLGSEVR